MSPRMSPRICISQQSQSQRSVPCQRSNKAAGVWVTVWVLPHSTASHHTDTLNGNSKKNIPNFKTTCHYFMCRYGWHHVDMCESIWQAHSSSGLPPAILLHSATQSSVSPVGRVAIWALFTQTLTVTLQPSSSMKQQQTCHPLAPKKLLKSD